MKLTTDLICFLDLHNLSLKEKQDTDYVANLICNYLDEIDATYCWHDVEELAKLYNKLP